MIRLDCEQGSAEWKEARRGIPTASNFGKIITPKTGKLSAQSVTYRYKLLAEWLSGEVDDEYTSEWMSRGWMMEPEAVKWYEFERDVTVDRVGFCYLNEKRMVGASPDGLVGHQGGLEIKCPKGENHLRFLMTGDVPDAYRPQIQGNLWITGRKWWDFMSYHDSMPSRIVRVERDEEYIDTLANAMIEFDTAMAMMKEMLGSAGYHPANTEEAVNA